MHGKEALSAFILLLSSLLQVALCRSARTSDSLTFSDKILDMVVDHKHTNVTVILQSGGKPIISENFHVENCRELREELEDKINELNEKNIVNSRLAITVSQLQTQLWKGNRDSALQISVLQQQLQEAINKLDIRMTSIYKKGLTVIELHNFVTFIEHWSNNQITIQITTLQTEQEKMIAKLEGNTYDMSKLILQILTLKNRLNQIQTKTSPESKDLHQELQTKLEHLQASCDEFELNCNLYLQVLELQSVIWNFEAKTSDEVASDNLPDFLKRLEDKMNQLPDREDDDSKVVLKILALQSIVRGLQRQSLNQTVPDKVTGLEKEITSKKKELEEALMQLKHRHGRNTEILLQIIEMQKKISDLWVESQNPNATAQIAGLQRQLNKMDERYFQLQTSYNALHKELEEKSVLLKKCVSENAGLASQVNELEISLVNTSHQKSVQITMLQKQLENTITRLKEKENDNSKLVLQILTLQSKLKELQEESSRQIVDLQFELQEKTRKLEKKTKQLEINMNLNSKLVLQILELQGIIWDLEKGIANRTNFSSIAELLTLLQNKISQLDSNTDDESKTVLKIFTLQSIVRELRREALKLSDPQQVAEIQNKLKEKTKDLEEAMIQLTVKKDENSILLAKILVLQDKLSEVKASNQTASLLISGMMKRLKDVDDKYARLQTNYSELQTQFSSAEKEYSQLKTKYNELQKKLNKEIEADSRLQKQLNDKDEEYSILQAKYDGLQEQLREKNENCSRLQSEYDELKDNLEAADLKLQENYKDLRKQLTEKETEYSRLEHKYHDLRNQLKDKTVDYNKLQEKYSELQVELIEVEDSTIKTAEVSLDPDTAHPKLRLSANNRVLVMGSSWQDVPDSLQRFDVALAVLGKEAYTSGRHYWEAQVSQQNCFSLGVASASAQRKGSISLQPSNGYWTIIKNRREEFSALDRTRISLRLDAPLHRIGVLVDYKKGQISFYNPDSRSHIYTFSGNTFKEKLFPFIFICEDDKKDAGQIIISPASKDVAWLQ